MKKAIWAVLSALLLTACNMSPLDFLTGNLEADFDETEELWAVSGITAPYGQQEIHRLHYDGDDGLVPAEATFKDGKMTLVFPSGAYRTIGYTLDRKSKTVTFDEPLTYGCTVKYNGEQYVGQDIKRAKFDMMTLSMAVPGTNFKGDGKFMSFYDPSAASFAAVDIDKQQWRIAMVNMTQHDIIPLYEIKGEYGTMDQGTDLGAEGAPKWARECVYENALFPYVEGVDLCKVHFGPQWCTPTEADAQWLLDNCNLLKALQKDSGKYYMYFVNKATDRSLGFPIGEVNEEMGFWLSNGKALVYKATDPHNDTSTEARIITPEIGAKYFLRPVAVR